MCASSLSVDCREKNKTGTASQDILASKKSPVNCRVQHPKDDVIGACRLEHGSDVTGRTENVQQLLENCVTFLWGVTRQVVQYVALQRQDRRRRGRQQTRQRKISEW